MLGAEVIVLKQWIQGLPWQRWKEKTMAFWNRSGFAVVLLLCAGMIGASMFLGGEELQQEPTPAQATPMATLRPIPAVNVPLAEPAAAATPEPSKPPLMLPVLGGEGMGYAPDVLLYSKTMGEWTTHDGVDLTAPEGTQALAAADGEVAEAFLDPSWGNVVLIDHEDGLRTGYASLGAMLVAPGDIVKAGQAIGTVGSSAQTEWEEGPHIHFYVLSAGEIVDPAQYLR